MALITTGSHPKALWEGVYEWFGQVYNRYTPEWTDLVDKKMSRKNFEEIVQSTTFGLAPVKEEGKSVSYTDHQQGYVTRATHVVYGLGYAVTRENLEDNLYKEISLKNSSLLAESMHQTKENVVANVYNRAFNSSYTFGDGVELIASTHPDTTGGTSSNILSTAAALSEAALEDIAIQIGQATDDVGLRIQLKPVSIHIPIDLQFEAERILKSIQRVSTADNDLNAIKTMSVFPGGAKVNHYLSSTTAWFVRTSISRGGLCLFQRRPLEFTQDNDFDTENLKAKTTERYSVTCADWRAIYGSNAS